MFPWSVLSSLPWWAVALLGYASLSSLLLAAPQLLFPLRPKRVEVAFPVRFGAHRGGAGERPENSLAAFDHALDCGCTLLELDVRLTRDLQVVVVHDATMARTTGQAVAVSQVDYADLPFMRRRLQAPPPFSPPGTEMAFDVDAAEGSKEFRHAYAAPLLSQVLERYTHSTVNIDLKSHSTPHTSPLTATTSPSTPP